MQGDGKKRLWTLPLLLGAGLMASAVAEENAERSKEGFIEGSEVNLLLRNFYFNRDFRKGQSSPAGGGYTEEWVQGFMANFSSGFTQGTLGVGIDAFAQLGVRQATVRSDSFESDLDEVRLIVEYPLQVL